MLIGLGCNIEGSPCATAAALELNFNSNRAYYLCYDCLADASAMLVPPTIIDLFLCLHKTARGQLRGPSRQTERGDPPHHRGTAYRGNNISSSDQATDTYMENACKRTSSMSRLHQSVKTCCQTGSYKDNHEYDCVHCSKRGILWRAHTKQAEPHHSSGRAEPHHCRGSIMFARSMKCNTQRDRRSGRWLP